LVIALPTARCGVTVLVVDGRLRLAALAVLVAQPMGSSDNEPIPAEYLTEVLDAVEEQAYYADRVDWDQWRADAEVEAVTAQVTADTYTFVQRLLNELGDDHSFFVSPPSGDGEAVVEIPFVAPAGAVDADSIGWLNLPAYASDDIWGAEYVDAAHDVLAAAACGWIVDLRFNGGGNLYPMLAALAPLLGPGPLLGYRDRHGRTDSWTIDDDGTVVATGWPPPPRTDHIRFIVGSPIAVLHGPGTASSGEGVVMALRGRPGVRSFGLPTAGVPTGNLGVEFSDGSVIYLTVAVGVDFAGDVHETAIEPDVPASGTAQEAQVWLADQPACQHNLPQ
jgi:carboxyl-terminal processing protease